MRTKGCRCLWSDLTLEFAIVGHDGEHKKHFCYSVLLKMNADLKMADVEIALSD